MVTIYKALTEARKKDSHLGSNLDYALRTIVNATSYFRRIEYNRDRFPEHYARGLTADDLMKQRGCSRTQVYEKLLRSEVPVIPNGNPHGTIRAYLKRFDNDDRGVVENALASVAEILSELYPEDIPEYPKGKPESPPREEFLDLIERLKLRDLEIFPKEQAETQAA